MENGGDSKRSAKADRDAVAGKASAGKIFIGGLSWETTTDKLTKHFKKYGDIVDSVVMRDRLTGHPRGFGFITYSDPSVIDKVMKDSHLIDGRTVEIKRSVPRENMKGPKTKKIFVGGIPPTVTEGDFKNYFARFGTVVEHQIMHDHASGRSRGFGFITFDSEQAVEDILSQGKMLELGGKQVEIKKAEPKKTSQDAEPAYGPPSGRGGYEYGPGGYGGYDDGYGRPGYGIGLYGGRGGGYNDGMYGSGGYSSGSYSSGHGSSGFGGYGSGSLGSSYGAGYGGSILNQYGDSDLYSGVGYGGYSSSFGGSSYGSLGGGYGGGYSSSRSSGRYHPYARN